MNKVSFLNEKEQAAADNLLGLLAGLTAESIVNTDVEAIADSYQHIVSAASIRHHSIIDLPRLGGPTSSEHTVTSRWATCAPIPRELAGSFAQ